MQQNIRQILSVYSLKFKDITTVILDVIVFSGITYIPISQQLSSWSIYIWSFYMLFHVVYSKYIVKYQKSRKQKMQPGTRKYEQLDKEFVWKMTENWSAIYNFPLEISSLLK